MSLREQVVADLRAAMRARNEHAVSAIRMLRAAIVNYEISQRGPNDPAGQAVPDEEVLNVVRKEIGAHREALEYAEKAGRPELIAKEQAMIAVLEQYMPAQLSDDDIRSTVEQLIAEHGPEFRKVMPQAAPRPPWPRRPRPGQQARPRAYRPLAGHRGREGRQLMTPEILTILGVGVALAAVLVALCPAHRQTIRAIGRAPQYALPAG